MKQSYQDNVYINVMKYLVYTSLSVLFMIFTVVEISAQNGPLYEQSELDELASFEGGKPALYKFVTENMQVMSDKRERGVKSGDRVLLTFVIEASGHISDIKCHPEDMEPAFRIMLEEMYDKPLWKAGKIENEKVSSEYILPIHITYE